LLYGAVAALDCELIGTIETATHLLFAGAILHTDVLQSATPLIWHDRGYRALAKRTNGAPQGATEAGKNGVQ
jgi:flavin reductase (DIM6/NTAB) family NADH-FMN oxidoreductase RutF